jgi:hypothetical protein
MMPAIKVSIDEKYNGPTGSGNGGYVAGLLAKYVDSDIVKVTLRLPPPLNTELEIIQQENVTKLLDRDKVVAEASPGDINIDLPVLPSWEEAQECSKRYPGFERHAFPRCYVCGPQREVYDGLRLFTGVNHQHTYVASPFVTFPELFDNKDHMNPEQVWAALDCPGAYAISQIDEEKVLVLGQITAQIIEPIHSSDQLLVVGWFLGKERKKNYSGTAIVDALGKLKAIAKATWIEVDPDLFIAKKVSEET